MMNDSTSVEQFYRQNDGDLRHMIHSRIWRDRDLAQDVAQDFYLMLSAHPVLDVYDSSRAQFSTYIYGCMQNILNTSLKRSWSERQHIPYDEHHDNRQDKGISYELYERVMAFRSFIQANCDTTRAMEYLECKLIGKPIQSLGQSAWNEYHKLLNDFLRAEKFTEDQLG